MTTYLIIKYWENHCKSLYNLIHEKAYVFIYNYFEQTVQISKKIILLKKYLLIYFSHKKNISIWFSNTIKILIQKLTFKKYFFFFQDSKTYPFIEINYRGEPPKYGGGGGYSPSPPTAQPYYPPSTAAPTTSAPQSPVTPTIQTEVTR